jgi:fumarate hydratase class II
MVALSIKISGLDEIQASLQKELARVKQAKLEEVVPSLISDLKDNTPVDTGRARHGWKGEVKDGRAVIENDVPYIGELNRGHSKQAPAYFIEQTILSHKDLRPEGALVDYQNNPK